MDRQDSDFSGRLKNFLNNFKYYIFVLIFNCLLITELILTFNVDDSVKNIFKKVNLLKHSLNKSNGTE